MRKTRNDLIRELLKFPPFTSVHAETDCLVVSYLPTTKNAKDLSPATAGVISATHRGVERPTQMGSFDAHLKSFEASDSSRIRRWLLNHPMEALDIAYRVIDVMYLNADTEEILPPEDAAPRCSGADMVDNVVESLTQAGIMPLIEELQQSRDNE